MSDTLFTGFDEPLENWSKLPHAFIGALPLITSLAELKVVLYVLRHTWGYREYETAKHITTDEFANGRKKKDGTRIDKGIGMSEPSIRSGVRSALEHGFIKVTVDSTDLARIEKAYQLNIHESERVKDLPPEGKEFTSGGKNVLPRSEKDTLVKKLKKDSAKAQPPTGTNKITFPKSLHSYTAEHICAYQALHPTDMTALVRAWRGDMYNSITEFSSKIGKQFIETHKELTRLNIPIEDYSLLCTITKKKDAWKDNPVVTDILAYTTDYKPKVVKQADKPLTEAEYDWQRIKEQQEREAAQYGWS